MESCWLCGNASAPGLGNEIIDMDYNVT
jgi:hypothetical protein